MLCKQGNSFVETNGGIYFICENTGNQCQFVRWCSQKNEYEHCGEYENCPLKEKEINENKDDTISNHDNATQETKKQKTDK